MLALGAANINPDDKTYADASIVREGPVGDQGGGAFSGGVSCLVGILQC